MEKIDYILVQQLKYIVFFCVRKANGCLCYTNYSTSNVPVQNNPASMSCRVSLTGGF